MEETGDLAMTPWHQRNSVPSVPNYRGLNYRAHADELKLPYPKNPVALRLSGERVVKPGRKKGLEGGIRRYECKTDMQIC